MRKLAIAIIMKQILIGALLLLIAHSVVDAGYAVQAIQKCENGPPDGMKVKHSWNAKTSKLTASIDLPFEINNKVTYDVAYYAKVLKIWMKLKTASGSLCNLLHDAKVKALWTKVVAEAKGSPSKSCPIKKAHYALTNFAISSNDLNLKVPSGDYAVDVTISNNKEPVLCRRIIVKGT